MHEKNLIFSINFFINNGFSVKRRDADYEKGLEISEPFDYSCRNKKLRETAVKKPVSQREKRKSCSCSTRFIIRLPHSISVVTLWRSIGIFFIALCLYSAVSLRCIDWVRKGRNAHTQQRCFNHKMIHVHPFYAHHAVSILCSSFYVLYQTGIFFCNLMDLWSIKDGHGQRELQIAFSYMEMPAIPNETWK